VKGKEHKLNDTRKESYKPTDHDNQRKDGQIDHRTSAYKEQLKTYKLSSIPEV